MEGLGGAALVGRVLQMVSEPTHVVARTGQCSDIGRMARVGLRWDTRHGIWVGTACTGQCADIGRMARVGLRWDTRHGIWVGTGRTVVR
jgi:hypothetical protein